MAKPQSINSVCNSFPIKLSVGAKARGMVAHLNYAKPSSLRNGWLNWECSANSPLLGWYKENPQHISSQSPRQLWWILGHFLLLSLSFHRCRLSMPCKSQTDRLLVFDSDLASLWVTSYGSEFYLNTLKMKSECCLNPVHFHSTWNPWKKWTP